ncbi:MAG: glutamine--fructose-6-phosphate transaminase (isomerizing) [Thalassobaculales bacterium]
MCGIIGIVGREAVAERIVEGLRGLEYRGYDSAGVATLEGGAIERRRAEGKLANLAALVARAPLPGLLGIGHTRWATHGAPNETNAHPHSDGRVAVVHNGIIENHRELREELEAKGHRFETATDTETVVHLLSAFLGQGLSPLAAFQAAIGRLHGAFALAVIIRDAPDRLFCARRGSPLAIGHGEGEMYLGSDAIALAPMTDRITYLEDGDHGVVERGGLSLFDAGGAPVQRPSVLSPASGAMIGKGNHRHFMHKEIFEQPGVLGDRLRNLIDPATRRVRMPFLDLDLAAPGRLTIVACGTSYYAGMVAKYWFEGLCRVPVEVDIASEFRYRDPVLPPGGLCLFISQSGETADTLAALDHARRHGQTCLAVVNVPRSSIARQAHGALHTYAGPEIGVASTKAFTSQLGVLACLALAMADSRGTLAPEKLAELTQALIEVPAAIAGVLAAEDHIHAIARGLQGVRSALYLARGSCYPIALEGALKLKEISYIHAEGYAAGEMKHGPIALIDEHVPVVVLAPSDALFEKTASNIQEVAARGGRLIIAGDPAALSRLGELPGARIPLAACHPFVAPLVYAVPMQLLAYHAAVLHGTDVDQPRNLAKSVTVE